MLEELGQNGNDIILFYYILLQIVGCSIIKNFAQFVGFVISPSELVMLLHSLPVNYLYKKKGKGSFYIAPVSSPLDRSKRFTLFFV